MLGAILEHHAGGWMDARFVTVSACGRPHTIEAVALQGKVWNHHFDITDEELATRTKESRFDEMTTSPHNQTCFKCQVTSDDTPDLLGAQVSAMLGSLLPFLAR